MLVSAAHAKLNLSLAITGRRADGFHELISLVAPIALADTLTLDVGRPLGLTCDDASLPVDGSNLVNFNFCCQRMLDWCSRVVG